MLVRLERFTRSVLVMMMNLDGVDGILCRYVQTLSLAADSFQICHKVQTIKDKLPFQNVLIFSLLNPFLAQSTLMITVKVKTFILKKLFTFL